VAEYLTTAEVAKYLRLNQKKIYALVSEGRLPATRISGKWLFPKHLIDRWVEDKTLYPEKGLLKALVSDLLVIQGSDDWLFSSWSARFMAESGLAVASAKVGSLAGLSAIASHKAHMAGCHVDNIRVQELAGGREGCYLFNLLTRSQGLIFDRSRHGDIDGLAAVAERGYRFAARQPLSGTHKLVERLCTDEGIAPEDLDRAGPYDTHLELALAVRSGNADAGVGIRVAADMCGLDFIPLAFEPYKLAVPVSYAGCDEVSRFLDFVIAGLGRDAKKGVPGYEFDDLGVIETICKSRKEEEE